MLFGLPLQIFSGLGTFLMSYMAARNKSKMEMESAERKHMMELLAMNNKNATALIKAQNEVLKNDPYFAWTRRTLAIGGGLGILVAILFVIPFLDIPWIYTYDEVPFQIFGINFGIVLKRFVAEVGIPVLFGEAALHIAAMIFAFYFGNSMGKVKNPYR